MRLSGLSTGIFAAALCLANACGGSSSSSTPGDGRQIVSGASVMGGAAATFHPGALPAPHGSLTLTVTSTGVAINGGTTAFDVSSTGTVVTVYVSVDGQTGYWEIPVPPGLSAAQVLLTFAQQIAADQTASITFEVADAAGNVSAPMPSPVDIMVVGIGDVSVALTWNADNDLDLHVVDPSGTEIYYANKTSTDGTMLLDLDSNAGCSIDGIDAEHVVWPVGKAPHGQYTVRVDNWENCQTAAANYVVTVQVTGHASQTFTGSFPATDPGDNGGAGDGVMVTQFTF